MQERIFRALALSLSILSWSACTHHTGPTCTAGGLACSYTRMPAYDQTNPNFAAYLSPLRFDAETNPVSNVLGTCNNPYDASWLPYGPINGDPDVTCPGWWYTAICCPTAEAMALTAAIESRSPSTRFSGWTSTFFQGEPLAIPASGLTNQTGPIFPFATVPPRPHMRLPDLQRVMDVALPQGTMPNGGGPENYISSAAVTGDFTPPGVGFDGGANTVSNTTFSNDIKAGEVVVIARHPYTAHVTSSGGVTSITFTFNGGGHCLAVKGYNTSSSGTISLQIIDPVGGVKEWISIINLTTGTFTVGGQTINVTLPNGWSSVGVWPDSSNPVTPLTAITDGELVTFVDEYHTLKVP
jgi:hypothetical protein